MAKIYAAANPMWYADTFIFAYMEVKKKYIMVRPNTNG